jgi:dienelactone hydrolase
MSESAVHRPHPEAPAQVNLRPAAAGGAWQGLNAQRFEIVSRGDFVPGILYLPDPAPQTPLPLLLLQHGTAEGMDSRTLEFAASWVKQGLAVATIDLPLHGERSSPKLSERLISGWGQIANNSVIDSETGVLVEEFARQTTSDLIRTLDGLVELPAIDGDRVGFMGSSLGAIVGSYLLAHDPRPRAAVLALTRGGQGPRDLDPATYLAKVSGPSIMIVTTNEGEKGSAAAPDALFEAASEPKELLRLASNSQSLPDDALTEVWRFLSKELGL